MNRRPSKRRLSTAAPISLLMLWVFSVFWMGAVIIAPTQAQDTAAETGFGAISQAPPLAKQIQVKASTDLSKVVVGQQIVLRVLVLGDGPLPPGRLILPNLDEADLLILGEDRRIARSALGTDSGNTTGSSSGDDSDRSDRQSGSNGGGSRPERWIFERRYALFPRSTGRLEIPPSVYSAWRPGADTPEALRSQALSIEVLPAQPPPSDAAADSPWLPAKALSLSEAGANSVHLAPGQVIERMLTIKAVGLRAEDLPPIRPLIPFQLQVSEDAPRLWNERGPQGVTGYRTERITLSTPEPGLYRLPAVNLDWWDVDTERWERASTPDWQLKVAEFDSASRRPAPDWRRDGVDSAANINSVGSPTASVPKQPWVVAHWLWITGTLGLLLLAWLLWRLYQRGTLRQP